MNNLEEISSDDVSELFRILLYLLDRIDKVQSRPIEAELLADLMRRDETRHALTFLADSRITTDDLKKLTQALRSHKKLDADPAMAMELRDIVFRILVRFLKSSIEPSEQDCDSDNLGKKPAL